MVYEIRVVYVLGEFISAPNIHQANGEPESGGETALYLAVKEGHIDTARTLINSCNANIELRNCVSRF